MIFWEKQRLVTSYYTQCAKPVCETFNITQMQFDILMFMTNNPLYDTAADIVRMRALTKSHVSSALKDLEERGLIVRSFKPGNSKTAHITITEASAPIIEMGKQAQLEFVHNIFSGYSPAEIELCKDLFIRMCDNAGKNLR